MRNVWDTYTFIFHFIFDLSSCQLVSVKRISLRSPSVCTFSSVRPLSPPHRPLKTLRERRRLVANWFLPPNWSLCVWTTSIDIVPFYTVLGEIIRVAGFHGFSIANVFVRTRWLEKYNVGKLGIGSKLVRDIFPCTVAISGGCHVCRACRAQTRKMHSWSFWNLQNKTTCSSLLRRCGFHRWRIVLEASWGWPTKYDTFRPALPCPLLYCFSHVRSNSAHTTVELNMHVYTTTVTTLVDKVNLLIK